jgi:hypothetical protein
MLSAKQAGAAAMPDIRARVMECSEAEEHILTEVYRRHFCSVAPERGHVNGTMT